MARITADGDKRVISRVLLTLLAGGAALPLPLLKGEEKPAPAKVASEPEIRADSVKAQQKVKETIAAFFKLALMGNADEAAALASDPEKGFKHAEDVKKALTDGPIEIRTVQLNAEEGRAFVISKPVTLRDPDPDDRVAGVLAIALVKSKRLTRRGWRIRDIDFESREGAQAKLRNFLKAN